MKPQAFLRTIGAAALVASLLGGCNAFYGETSAGPQPTTTTGSVDYGSYGPAQPSSGFSTTGAVIAGAGSSGVFGTTDQITVDDSGPFPNNSPSFDSGLSDLSADDQALLAGTGLDLDAEASAASALTFPGDDGSQSYFDADIGTTIYFATNSSELSDDARAVLRKQAAWLNVHENAVATVEGHTDERGTREYNLALGERRASAVRGYLTALGVANERVRKVSFGKERPAVPGSTEAAWNRNRRSVTVLTGSDSSFGPVDLGLQTSSSISPVSTVAPRYGSTSIDDLLNDPVLNDLSSDPLLNDPLLNDPLLN